jgi:hypothetical protein
MTRRLSAHEISFVDPTPNPVDGLKGMTTGGAVYHHGGVSRSAGGHLSSDDVDEWRAACRALGVIEA